MESKFSVDVQKLFLEIMLSEAECFVRVQNIYNPDNFHKSLKQAAKFIQDYSLKYASLPTQKQVKASAGVNLEIVEDIDDSILNWFFDEFENFTRHEELLKAVLKSSDLIEKGDYDPIENIIKNAVQISLTRDLGIDYWEDPKERLQKVRNNSGQISTGWADLDFKLFGGMNRGELNIFAGGTGSGKSLFMQNLCVNWANKNLNGIYVTLELSETLSAMRIDSMMTDMSFKELLKDLDNIKLKLKTLSKKQGKLQIKYLPAQSNVNDLRSYIKEYQIKSKTKIDYVCVDYLDLLMPVSAKVSPSDLFVKDKYVSEELRNLAKELNIILVTASQLNRCLALDTKVIANNKEVQIADVKVGDKLRSNHGDVEVLEKLPIIKQPVFKIKTKSGKEIVCSNKHQFETSEGLRSLNEGLSIGDKLYIRDLE